MNKEFLDALTELEREKNISKEDIITAIEDAVELAYKKNYGNYPNVRVIVDREDGEVLVLMSKEVVEEVEDDTDEATTSVAYYDGDGTEETTVTSVKGSYTFKGTYDKEDEAMALIAGLKYKLGNDRLVWHKVVDSDGKNQHVGIATVSAIKAGSGNNE